MNEILASGALRSVGTAPAETDVISVAIHPSAQYAYAVNQTAKTISVYDRDLTTGMLTLRNSLAVPSFRLGKFSLHSSGRKAVVSVGAGLRTLSIDDSSGALELGEHTALPEEMFGVDPTGRFVFVVTDRGSLSSYVLRDDGSLDLVSSVQITDHHFAEEIVVAPSGRFVYVSFRSGGITIHRVNPNTGVIAPEPLPGLDDGRGPFAMHPSGLFAYAAGEESADDESGLFGLVVLQVDPDEGLLIRRRFEARIVPIQFLTVSPSGRSLCTMGESAVETFSIDTTGACSSLGAPAEVGGRAAGITLFDAVE